MCKVKSIICIPSRHAIFREYSLSVRSTLQCSGHDLTITNVDLLANSSNHRAIFPEYSKNIPRISVSKIFQGYPPEYCNVFMKSKSAQNCFVRVIL